jgi:hypothetical protein
MSTGAPLEDCRALETAVQRGKAKLIGTPVEVKPPNPLPRKGGSLPPHTARP